MTRKYSAAIAAALLLLAACSSPKGEDCYPAISKGQQWDYSFEYTTPSTGYQIRKVTQRVEGEETINGKTYTRTVTDFSGLPQLESETTYFRRAPEGIYKVNGKHRDQPEYLETPFPLTLGKTWNVPDPDGELEYKVEGFETVETPSRKYLNCLKISFRNKENPKGFEGYSYHSAGIGEVKAVINSSGVTFTTILEKYKL